MRVSNRLILIPSALLPDPTLSIAITLLFLSFVSQIYTSSCRTAKYLDEFSSERVCLNYRAKYILSIWDIFELILDTTLLFFFIFALINGQE